MVICPKCRCRVYVPCTPANDNAPPAANDNEPDPKPVIVAADCKLRCIDHFRALAIRTRYLNRSRYKIANWLAEAIYWHEGPILWPGGAWFPVPDNLIETVFNGDLSFRWLTDFVRFAVIPPKQRPQWPIVPRLRVIDLAFRISDQD